MTPTKPPVMADDEAMRIAGTLTKAQREVIAMAWPYPDFHRTGENISYCPVQVNARNGDALNRIGLTAMKAEGGPRLTPLGLRVRSALQNGGAGE